eukprot:714032-Alexandrium_andersonii.AAC.1
MTVEERAKLQGPLPLCDLRGLPAHHATRALGNALAVPAAAAAIVKTLKDWFGEPCQHRC